jgi:hypothetical protein
VLYGVTLEEAGVSKLIGMRLRDEQERPREQAAVVGVEERAAESTGDAAGAAAEKAEDGTADDRAGEAEDATAEEAA